MRVAPMTEQPVDLDKHRGMAAQKATDLRRALAEVESNVRQLREREADLENRLMTVPAASWPEAATKARYLLNLYAASLPAEDAPSRPGVSAVRRFRAAQWRELRRSRWHGQRTEKRLCQEAVTWRSRS